MRIFRLSSNNIRLWLDDERDPSNPIIMSKFGSQGNEIWIKTPREAIDYLKQGNVSFVSFDHDLGELGEGSVVANWIDEAAYNEEIPRLEWRIHSQNPMGAKNILAAMNSAERWWDRDGA